ncbi:MAG: hypothetical protein M1438_10670 [Deltaproteobacteria bacterium]|nr:hypothetical protein [Deltaproteobacteria bacterium]
MRIIKSLLAIGLCLALGSPVLAQTGGGQGMGPGPGMGRGMGPGGGIGRMYNPQTVTTIKGTVESQGPRMGPRMQHQSWVIKTDAGKVTVHLGPAWYLNQHQMTIKPGDAMVATGSQMEMGGGTMMVAKEATVQGKTLKLRDDQGLPLWRGQGQRQSQ